jgi:hypothetical protein
MLLDIVIRLNCWQKRQNKIFRPIGLIKQQANSIWAQTSRMVRKAKVSALGSCLSMGDLLVVS